MEYVTTISASAAAAEIRLCAAANGTPLADLPAFDALDYEPPFPAQPPPPPRRRPRPAPSRRPPAAPRLVSWLVEGRGR